MVPNNARICILVTSHVTASTFLRGYLAALRREGWTVALVCSYADGLEEFAETEGIEFHPVSMRRNPAPLRDLAAFVQVLKILRRLRPHVVVYATPKASLLGAVAARLVGTRARIYELWGLRLETTRGIAFSIYALIEKLVARLSTSVVANSPSLAKKVESLGLMGRSAPVVLGSGSSHGVDVERFSREAAYPDLDVETQRFLSSTSGFTVGFVGRLHPDKGIDTLLEALQSCSTMSVPVRAILVGADEGASLDEWLQRSDWRVPIHLSGQVPDTRAYLAHIDVLVLMSLREGFPNVVLEAAGMEIPAIVSDSTGTVDSVVEGVTGFVLPTGDVTALASKLAQLSSDPSLVERLGKAARRRVIEHFSQEHVWKLHSDHFATALSAQAEVDPR